MVFGGMAWELALWKVQRPQNLRSHAFGHRYLSKYGASDVDFSIKVSGQ